MENEEKVFVVANIGLQDIRYNISTGTAKPKFCSFEYKGGASEVAEALGINTKEKFGARIIASHLLEKFKENEDIESKLKFPLLMSVIKNVVDKHKSIEKLILVVTDQENPSFCHTDTIHSGLLIKKVFQKKSKDSHIDVSKIKAIELLEVTHADPQRADLAYEFFKTELPKKVPPEKVTFIYPVISAGIPHLNNELHHVSLNLYPGKCQPKQVKQKQTDPILMCDGDESCEINDVDIEPFMRDMAIEVIKTHIKRCDYSGAIDVIERIERLPLSDFAKEILYYAEMCKNFNFDEANQALEKLDKLDRSKFKSDERKQLEVKVERWKNEIKEAGESSVKELLKHLLSVIKINAKNKWFYFFVVNMGSFYENVLRYITWKVTGIKSLEATNSQFFYPKGKKTRCDRSGFCKILNDHLSNPGNDADIQKYLNIYSKVDNFTPYYDKRNGLLHKIQGVSENTIEDLYKKDTKRKSGIEGCAGTKYGSFIESTVCALEELLKELLGKDYIYDFYDDLNEYVSKLLESRA
ncbi:MAG: hypothetical protein HQK89_06685 [Nitrospirae bacterium]|nr:hypothetical protein [Nitrospirota bacterium]